jgi:hypothetical protein
MSDIRFHLTTETLQILSQTTDTVAADIKYSQNFAKVKHHDLEEQGHVYPHEECADCVDYTKNALSELRG